MAQPVDTLLVRVEADLKDVKKSLAQLEKDTKRTADRTNKAFTTISRGAKGLLGAVVVREFAQAAAGAVDFASHVEEAQAKSSVVFGAFTDDVRKSLTDFGKEVGRSEFALEEMAASVQDTFVPMGFARGEAADLSVSLTKLATDVASFNNASDTETMKAFQSALVGNHETVRQFGIVITEAELKAELFEMGITKSMKQVTAAEKVQARYNLIMKGTTDAHGDAARTAESYANRVKAMEASTDRLRKALGDKLMPLFTSLVIKATEVADSFTEMLTAGDIVSEAQTVEQALERIRKAEDKLIANADKYEKAQSGRRSDNKLINDLEAEARALGKVIQAERDRITELERADAVLAARKSEEEAKEEEEKTKAGLALGADFVKEQKDALALLRLELQGVTDAELELTKAQQGGAQFTEKQIADYHAQAEALKQVQHELEQTEIVQDSIKQGIENFSVGVSDAITNMVTGVSSGMDGLKDIVRQSINQIISDIIRVHLVNKAINAALGFAGLDQFKIGANSASGGAVQGGRPVLVGERGPELIIPKSASTVRNAHDTRSIMARGGNEVAVYQTINVTTGVQDTVKAEIANLMPQIADGAKSAVLDARRRGGSFSRAF